VIDPHRLAEERSLAYHRVVAERLEREPLLLERARARVRAWRTEGRLATYAEAWERILSMPFDAMRRAVIEDSEAGRAQRQASPFAGAMAPRERWKLWREVRERLSR
jgi:hypothetical protein